jgi:hypothetical protein
VKDLPDVLKKLRMRRAPGENQSLDSAGESEAIEASGDAIVIATAIHDLADAIREHTRAISSDEDPEEYNLDLAGNPIA